MLQKVKKYSPLKTGVTIHQTASAKQSNIRDQAEIHFLCGRSLVESKAMKEAIEQFGCVLALQPGHVEASPSVQAVCPLFSGWT